MHLLTVAEVTLLTIRSTVFKLELVWHSLNWPFVVFTASLFFPVFLIQMREEGSKLLIISHVLEHCVSQQLASLGVCIRQRVQITFILIRLAMRLQVFVIAKDDIFELVEELFVKFK